MSDFVDAYDTRTGTKVPHSVPRHFVEELAPITGLSRTPSSRQADEPVAPAPAEPTPADMAEADTNPEEGNH